MGASHPQSHSVAARLSCAMAFFCICLMISVWPLWLRSPAELVQIPWLSVLCGVPGWVDRLALIILGFGLILLLFIPDPSIHSKPASLPVDSHQTFPPARGRTVGLLCFVISLGVLTALDQHRFQPWVCQFLLLGLLLLLAPGPRCGSLCRILVVSIYFWSGVSKLDAAFLVSHGQLLLSGMLAPLGIETTYWAPRTRELLTLLFPLGEVAVGICLLFRWTEKIGLAASLCMHLLLIWTLGLGLHHEWSVLIWNAYFIAQNLILFRAPFWGGAAASREESSAIRNVSQFWWRAALGWTGLAICYPALELIGYCDHWPAWAVYSARPAQVRIRINESALAGLPEHLRPFLGSPQPLEEAVPFRLEAWSFQTCGSPVYPQTRYRLALALALLEPVLPKNAWNVEIRETPDRFTGKRETILLQGATMVNEYCRHFWGNTHRRLTRN